MVKMNIKREEILAVYEAGPEAVITLIYTIIAENQKIIEQQAIRISELEERVKYLEERLNKNSRNSSKPPSTDNLAPAKPNPKSQRIKSGKKPGGQAGHIGTTLMMVDNPVETRVYTVDRCKNCGKNLHDEIAKDFERRQVFDIPPVKISATEHRGEIKICTCGCTNYAEFPEDVKFSVQYGTRLTGLAVYLHDYQLIPYDRCCQLLKDVCGCEISPATLIRAENICFENLKDFEDEIKKLLSQSPVIHSDETGSRINGQRHWLHVACTSQMTYYMVHAKRGSIAMDAMGILPGFNGTVVHDFWKPYFKYSCDHSLCNAHLTRELTGIYENYYQLWSNDMKALLLEIKSCVNETQKISDHLEPDQIRDFEEKYDTIIKIGLGENPPPLILQDRPIKRGKKKQSTAKNLLDRFIGYKDDILRFMHDFEVPFENNQAERDVRMMKVQQKISGTFRSTQGAVSFCRIRGYISTVKKNKLSVIDAIMDVFSGKAFIPNIAE
jgi:transposase